MNEDFYINNLDPEQEAFLKRKKNNDLKNGLKRANNIKTEITEIEKQDVPSNFHLVSDENKKNISEQNTETFLNQVEKFLDLTKSNKIEEISNKDNKNNSDKSQSNIEDVISKLIPNSRNINGAINLLEIEDIDSNIDTDNLKNNTNLSEETYKYEDIVEVSKIYYYAEMLDRFIGNEANLYELLEDESFIDIIKKELEKILKKEEYSQLNLIYSTSPLGTKYSSLMSELHKSVVFMNYIKKQSDIFMNEQPKRLIQLNWVPLYNVNYNNKAWLQPLRYTKETNESLTPWTRTGLLVWLIVIIISGLGSYFYSLKEGAQFIEIISPFILTGTILLFGAIVDFIGAFYIKGKYIKLERDFLDIKNSVNEISVNKKDLNPLMFDVCSYYVKRNQK